MTAKTDLTVTATVHQVQPHAFVVTFKSDGAALGTNAPKISLSRKPDHCYYRIAGLEGHDSHSPVFSSQDSAMEYVARVEGAFKVALEDYQGPVFPPGHPESGVSLLGSASADASGEDKEDKEDAEDKEE